MFTKLVGMSVMMVAALMLVAGFWTSNAAAQTATPTATPSGTPAACPTGTTLTVAAPTAAAPSTVTVTITPPLNIKAAATGDLTSYHVHYFIDTAATAAGTAVPTGDAKIIHSATLTQDLGALTPGSHTVTVVLGQVTHVACETRGSVTFTVAAAAAASPAAPKTGNAGLNSDSSVALPAFALLGLAFVLTAGARWTTSSSRTRRPNA
jgi:hypothetical protein